MARLSILKYILMIDIEKVLPHAFFTISAREDLNHC